MHRLLILIGCFLLSWQLAAQNPQAERHNQKAELAFANKKYSVAQEWYEKSLAADSTQQTVLFKLGRTAAILLNEPLALKYYKKFIATQPFEAAYKEAFMYVAVRELRDGNYAAAQEKFQQIKAIEKDPSPQLDKYLAACKFGLETRQQELSFTPSPLPEPINQFQKQYFPVLTADNSELFFTAVDEKGDENIFVSSKENQVWTKPRLVSKEITTENNEGTCSISADGRLMVFTKCGSNGCDLYSTYRVGGAWATPKKLGKEINTPYWESHPALSPDGRRLYFVSDRPQGVGKKDIWVSEQVVEGEWLPAENLGSGINTPQDELSPFIHANGQSLFFASNGHQTLGGFDLFKAERKGKNFLRPTNLGYPINTNADQVSIFISADGKQAFYAHDTKRQIQLYSFKLPEAVQESFSKTQIVRGKIVGEDGKTPLAAKVELLDLATQEVVGKTQSDSVSGQYLVAAPEGSKYALHISKQGYLFESKHIMVSDSANFVDQAISLRPLKADEEIVLNNIFFDSGKWELRPESFFELNKVVMLLNQNPKLIIQLNGHTDDIGSTEANQTLSEKRVGSVANYLTEKGCLASQFSTQGFGERQPIRPNDSEENRQLNRRIELKIKAIN